MKKIGIVGNGFVGGATNNGFNKNCTKFIVDPKLKTTLLDLKKFNPDYIFICVPTPMNEDGTQNDTIIKEVLKEISNLFTKPILIIKSTVLPDTILKLYSIYPKVVYNPEFLREKTADEDFLKTKNVIFGGPNHLLDKVENLYSNHTNCKIKHVYKTDLISASLMKYAINTFLATKVLFFNQFHDIFDRFDTDIKWDDFISMVSSDVRIGKSHMSVPGTDGKLGFGGACFPKDTLALLNLSKTINKEFSLLKEVIIANNLIRNRYETIDDREKEQGINYRIDIK